MSWLWLIPAVLILFAAWTAYAGISEYRYGQRMRKAKHTSVYQERLLHAPGHGPKAQAAKPQAKS